MIRITQALFCILIVTSLSGQVTPVAHYNFDGCSLTDVTGSYPDAIAFSGINCDCGVDGDAAILGGSGADSIHFSDTLSSLFSNDFTLSFYVKFDNTTTQMDILSVKSTSCQVDSSFSIKYVPITDQIDVEIGEDFNDVITLSVPFDHDICWHHIVLSKKERDYFLFYNDELGDQETAIQELVIDPSHIMAIANSACQGITDMPLIGKLDDLCIFDRFLDVQELEEINVMPNQIINPDTTVFLGDGVQILTGGSCDNTPTWTPINGVDDPTTLEPFISPPATDTYFLQLDYDGCAFTDSIAINVIDPDSLNCDLLLLPNAFTPNGDDLNDTYGISNAFIMEEMEVFQIYDRWGELVFETKEKNGKWDGLFKGEKVNPGMFLYIVKYKCQGETFLKSSNVSVLR